MTSTLCRPSVLDSFALLSGQLNTLLKVLRNDKTPPLRNRILLPLLLNPERDEELAVSAQQALPCLGMERAKLWRFGPFVALPAQTSAWDGKGVLKWHYKIEE